MKKFLHIGGPKDGEYDYRKRRSDYFPYNAAINYKTYYWRNIQKIDATPPKCLMIHKSLFKEEAE